MSSCSLMKQMVLTARLLSWPPKERPAKRNRYFPKREWGFQSQPENKLEYFAGLVQEALALRCQSRSSDSSV
jgi:hypothetical protein